MNYSEKLKDPRWQRKRLDIMQRDGFKCCFCGDDKTELHIHHQEYSGEPWEISDDKLKTTCKWCHGTIEFLKSKGIDEERIMYVNRIRGVEQPVCVITDKDLARPSLVVMNTVPGNQYGLEIANVILFSELYEILDRFKHLM